MKGTVYCIVGHGSTYGCSSRLEDATAALARGRRRGVTWGEIVTRKRAPQGMLSDQWLSPFDGRGEPSTRRHHATIGEQKIPTFKISAKAPDTMTAGEINKELDKLNAQDSTLGQIMIDSGRGYERPSDYLKLTDPLSTELRKNSDRRMDLRIEIERRYGPGAPSRLPTGRGYGPRSNKAPTRGGIGFGKRLPGGT